MLNLHEKVKRFMDFWSESRTVDRAGHMAKAYRSAIAELAALKAKSVEYLVPVKSGEAVVVGFDPDRLEEVATLADRIEKQKETIAEIESDIESFMSVVDHPTIGTLMSRVRQLANQLQSAVTEARNVAQAQAALHPDLLRRKSPCCLMW